MLAAGIHFVVKCSQVWQRPWQVSLLNRTQTNKLLQRVLQVYRDLQAILLRVFEFCHFYEVSKLNLVTAEVTVGY